MQRSATWRPGPLKPTPPPPSLSHSIPPSLTPSLSLSLSPSLLHSLTPSLPPSLTPSFPPSLPPSLTHSLTPFLPPFPPSLPPLLLIKLLIAVKAKEDQQVSSASTNCPAQDHTWQLVVTQSKLVGSVDSHKLTFPTLPPSTVVAQPTEGSRTNS